MLTPLHPCGLRERTLRRGVLPCLPATDKDLEPVRAELGRHRLTQLDVELVPVAFLEQQRIRGVEQIPERQPVALVAGEDERAFDPRLVDVCPPEEPVGATVGTPATRPIR